MKNRSGIFWLLAAIGAFAANRVFRRLRLGARPNYYTGKIILITGASRGIGKSLAQAFSWRGASLVLAARSKEQLRLVADECERIHPDIETLVVPTDVTVEADLDHLVAEAFRRFGRIDILVNNAGIVQGGPFIELREESLQNQFDTNLLATINLTRLVLPAMLERGSGHIVNMSSVMGRHAFPYMAAYSISKHGLAGFGEGLRRELVGSGVHMTTANIGFADTDMVSDDNRRMLARFGVKILPTGHVAEKVLEAVQLGQPEVKIGGIEFLAAWITRISPRLADAMWRYMMPDGYIDAAREQRTE